MTPWRTARREQHKREDDDLRDGAMGFLDHLDELRRRLIRSCIAVGIGMAVSAVFVDRIANFVLDQIIRTLPAGSALIYTNPSEGFSFWFNITLIAGLVLSAPFVMYQVWGFIAPGLYASEKKFVVPFILLTSAGTITGALFGNYVLFPGMMKFFATFSSKHLIMMPSINDTFDHYVTMMIGMVVVFQMPTLVYFLARLRLVTARFLWKHLGYAILIIFIVAALLTTSTDPWNQTIFALPMIGLYLISIVIAWIVGPKRDKESAGAASKLGGLVIAATAFEQARRRRMAAGKQQATRSAGL
jgi:sec-independent protein translocase protein TatC